MADILCKELTEQETVEKLLAEDNWLILTHQYPDGDTIGSAFALGEGLKQLGKKVRVVCSDMIPQKYNYLTEAVEWDRFTPTHLCAVDVADPRLLGEGLLKYAPRIELCIDHHTSNTHYAHNLYLKNYAAAAMVVFELLKAMNVTITSSIAEALYTGISTDTGCFKYSNTDALAHRMAAELLDKDIRMDHINRVNFDIKSRNRIALEKYALQGIRFDWCGRCAIMPITKEIVKKSNADENEMEGLASIPRQIEGVWVGVTMREIDDGAFKISIRTGLGVDACAIAKLLGGGGHVAAAGCTIDGPLDVAMSKILMAIKTAIPEIENEDEE